MSENIGILSTPSGDLSCHVEVNGDTNNVLILSADNTGEKGSAIAIDNDRCYMQCANGDNSTIFTITSEGVNILSISSNIATTLGLVDSIFIFGDNYIQYTSGLGICWGKDIRSNVVITFPIIFIEFPSIVYGYSSNSTAYRHIQGHNASTTGFTMAIYDENNTLYNNTNNASAEYIAIGRWK